MAREDEAQKCRIALTNWITRFREHLDDPVSARECFDYLVRDRYVLSTANRDEVTKAVIDPVLRRIHMVWRWKFEAEKRDAK